MSMRINLNIIKIIFLHTLMMSTIYSYTWVDDICELAGCGGCTSFKQSIQEAAKEIDKTHKELERDVKNKYNEDIITLLKEIDALQNDMAHISVHMAAMEKEANMDDKKLLFLLKKGVKINTLMDGKFE